MKQIPPDFPAFHVIWYSLLALVFSLIASISLILGMVIFARGSTAERSKNPLVYWLMTSLFIAIAALSVYTVVHGLITGEFPR
jgi:uncharacterized membrane protein YidH (DUF202 family)